MIPIWFVTFIVFALSILLSSLLGLKAIVGIIFIYLISTTKLFRNIKIAILAAFIVGVLYFNFTSVLSPTNFIPVHNVYITGKIDSHPIVKDNKTTFYLRTDHDSPYVKRLRVVCTFEAKVSKGDKVEIKANLKPPTPPTNPGEFNYPRYLYYEKVYYIATVEKETHLEIIQDSITLYSIVNNFRSHSQEFIKTTLPDNQSSILLGMLLGMKHELPAEQYEDFQITGIVHIFAVSGLHIGFILLISIWITTLIGLSSRIKIIITIIVMFFYCSVVGWPISVIRAFIMGTIGLIAYYSKRDNSLLNAWGLAGIIILLLDVYAIFKVSFQLSFLATLGLVYIFPVVRNVFNKKSKIIDILLVPLCAQITVLPLIAYYFNLFSPIGLISNIFISYLTGGIVIFGFLGILLAPLNHTLASIFLYPSGLFIEIILYLVSFFKNIPSAYSFVATPTVIAIMLYYFGLVIVLRGLIISNKKVFLSGLLIIILFVGSFYIPPSFRDKGVLEVVFIDVGQGDSILVKSPGGKFILIDGGGNDYFDVGSYIVLPYLYNRGITHLFMVINSHSHTDHLKGLEKVIEKISAKYIGLPSGLFEYEEYISLKQIAHSKSIPIIPLSRGMTINIEKNFSINVLHPGDERFANSEVNNQSTVLMIHYKNFSILLTGDIEKDAIDALLREQQLSPSTIVQAPHHGSAISAVNELYTTTKPLYAIISVGRNNRFNHPSPVTLELLNDNNINVLRTDVNGNINIKTNGETLQIEKFIIDNQKQSVNF